MNLKSLFKQPQNTLEGTESEQNVKVNAKTGDFNCPGCGAPLLRTEVRVNYYSCPKCDYYFRIGGRRRLDFICDKGSFKEFDADMISHDPLTFPNYSEKLDAARQKSGEKEAVICGVGKINGYPCAVFSMDANFMMGSMGAAVGEKITKLFEYATENKLPVLGVTVSGGARMQEGMVSLVQMAKTAGAVKKAQRRRRALYRASDQSHNRRSYRKLRHARRYRIGGTRRARRIRGPARNRADPAAEAARWLPKRGIDAEMRIYRRDSRTSPSEKFYHRPT